MSTGISMLEGALERVRGLAGRDVRPASSVLIVLNRSPFDGDTTWNALRLASTLQTQGVAVRIFVMNDAVDLVREGAMPAEAEFDLQAMVREFLAHGGRLKICTTCITRCGMHSGDVIPEGVLSTMGDLAAWVVDSDRALIF